MKNPFKDDGKWHKHRLRDRIIIRVCCGIGAGIFGGVCAVCGWAVFSGNKVSETVTTNTTTTTVLNGVSHVTTSAQTIDYEAYAPYFLGAGMVLTAILCIGCAVGMIWPDQA